MNKNKKVIIGILIVLIIVIGLVVTYKVIENSVTNRADFDFKIDNISSNPVATENHENNKVDEKIVKEVTWEEITTDGVNEELLLKNVDEKLLTEIATELQTLMDEAKEEERENPEILSDTEEYLKKFEKEFIQERTDKAIETAKEKQYDETQEAEDEEEI